MACHKDTGQPYPYIDFVGVLVKWCLRRLSRYHHGYGNYEAHSPPILWRAEQFSPLREYLAPNDRHHKSNQLNWSRRKQIQIQSVEIFFLRNRTHADANRVTRWSNHPENPPAPFSPWKTHIANFLIQSGDRLDIHWKNHCIFEWSGIQHEDIWHQNGVHWPDFPYQLKLHRRLDAPAFPDLLLRHRYFPWPVRLHRPRW